MTRTQVPARASLSRKSCCRYPPRKESSSIRKSSLRPRKSQAKTDRGPGFPPFSKLPKELRLRIWEMSTEVPRIVVIQTVKEPGKFATSENRGFMSPSPVPAILHVCSESRQVALRKYILCFPANGYWQHYSSQHPARIFFNFNRDTLYFRGEEGPYGSDFSFREFTRQISNGDMKKVQSIGFDLKTSGLLKQFSIVSPEGWRELKTFYVCLEKPRLDLSSAVVFSPLRKEDCWVFARECSRQIYGSGRMSAATASEKIAEMTLEKRSLIITDAALGMSKHADIRFVTVANFLIRFL